MEGAEKNRGNDNVSWRMNGVVSGDLVHQFVNQSHFPNQMGKIKTEEDEEIELSLGLSMNGRFGVDPARKKLRRTSSVSNLPYPVGSVENGCTGAAGGSYAPLVRTCSLPTDTEEWRRQESQSSVRCMEARKKRMEKLKNVRVVRSDNESSSEDGNGLHDDVNGTVSVQRLDSGIVRGIEKWNLTPSAQGSVGLRRMGSSGASDLHNQGARENPAMERPNVKAAESDARDEDNLLKNPLLDMPYVSTRGCGPNHSKIEGFLYRYKKGEEVKIVCVCHGLFLTPAEFVKHGGGGEVSQPLKHIVVNPFPLF